MLQKDKVYDDDNRRIMEDNVIFDGPFLFPYMNNFQAVYILNWHHLLSNKIALIHCPLTESPIHATFLLVYSYFIQQTPSFFLYN